LASHDFVLDIVSMLPVDIVLLCVVNVKWFTVGRLVRVVSTYKLFATAKTIARTNSLRLIQLMATYFIAAHWFGCGYLFLATWVEQDDPNWVLTHGGLCATRSYSYSRVALLPIDRVVPQ
jgi:hypothetical protein